MRKITTIIFLIMHCMSNGFAQVSAGEPLAGPDEPLSEAEIMPAFQGGVDSMYKFIYKNIQYPAVARDSGIQGMVITQFVVDIDSTLKRVRVMRGVGGGCNEEVTRVVQMMSDRKLFQPGQHEGRTVPVLLTVPVKFVLKKDKNLKQD